MSEPRQPAPRRRWRPDLSTAVVVLLPLLTVLAALLVHTDRAVPDEVAPTLSPLTRSTLICPPGGPDLSVATVSGATGEVTVRADEDEAELDLEPDRATSLELDRRAAVITGRDDLAPGLVANRYDRPWASTDCRPPVVDQWFTGVGAGAKHQSTLQLVNPDSGRAVVDVVVLGRRGEVDVPALRGLAVSGGATRRFDLAEIVPRRDDLALHVTTLRGRISASVRDSFQELGRGQGGTDELASQDEPSTSNLLLGIPAGKGQRKLVIANPGDDEGRATIKLVTADSVFAPADSKDVVLPPRSVVRVGLTPALNKLGKGDGARAFGVQVDSTVEATVGLVMFVEGDLAEGVATPPLGGAATVVLPKADKELVLGGATSQGVVTVSLWDKKGASLDSERVEVTGDRGYVVDLPRKARLMTVLPERTTISGVVLLTGDGAALVRLREPVLTGLEPYVRPGLP